MCHGVLYKQLTAWMLHGMLIDRYNEFFVQRIQRRGDSRTNSIEEDELGLSGISTKQIQQLLVSETYKLSEKALDFKIVYWTG